jgi:citrate lyase subunit beta/citryl-CoA lyase
MISSSPFVHSYLFVPGNRPDRFDKACAAGADAVIIDLEDAVAPPDKAAARDALTNWLDSERARANKVPVLVRINCINSGCFGDDLRLCRTPGIAGVVLPKAERVADVAAASPGSPVYPLIETALGFSRITELAAAPRVSRLLFGSIDFKLDMGIDGDRDELLFFRSQIVLASRMAGLLPPVDGVTVELDDDARVEDDTNYARRLGFGGKLCIHPNQVPVVNRSFMPSQQRIDWANKILHEAEAAGGGALAVERKLIERPVFVMAQRIIEETLRKASGARPN